MVTLSQCSKANVLDRATKRIVKANVSFDSRNSVLITVPLTSTFPTGELLPISFLDASLGVVRCLCRLSSPVTSPDHRSCTYRCKIQEQLSTEQRREDLKVPLEVLVSVTLSSSGDSAPAIVRNLSAGGVYLATSLAAPPGEQLTFTFRQKDIAVSLTAEILRVEATMDSKGRLIRGYGCRFVHLSPYQESQLRSYVFQENKRQFAAKKI